VLVDNEEHLSKASWYSTHNYGGQSYKYLNPILDFTTIGIVIISIQQYATNWMNEFFHNMLDYKATGKAINHWFLYHLR
jgi:c-di-AMP phosphodiesterase-like protein